MKGIEDELEAVRLGVKEILVQLQKRRGGEEADISALMEEVRRLLTSVEYDKVWFFIKDREGEKVFLRKMEALLVKVDLLIKKNGELVKPPRSGWWPFY